MAFKSQLPTLFLLSPHTPINMRPRTHYQRRTKKNIGERQPIKSIKGFQNFLSKATLQQKVPTPKSSRLKVPMPRSSRSKVPTPKIPRSKVLTSNKFPNRRIHLLVRKGKFSNFIFSWPIHIGCPLRFAIIDRIKRPGFDTQVIFFVC